jgi:hypothetical protein
LMVTGGKVLSILSFAFCFFVLKQQCCYCDFWFHWHQHIG